MKKTTFLLFCFYFINSFSQNYKVGDTIFLKKKIPVTNIMNADSYSILREKITQNEKNIYRIEKYELQKDSVSFLKLSQFFSTDLHTATSGFKKTFYHKNGKNSSEGYFEKGQKIGKWTNWYDNGKIMSETFLYKRTVSKKTKESEMISFWDKKGNKTVINGNGTYIYENDSTVIRGYYKNKKKHGKFNSHTNNKKNYEEYYKKGKIIQGKSWDKKGYEYSYKETFKTPYYPKGNKGVKKHIVKNFKIPEYALENKISGRMLVSFKIEKDGSISNINVIKKLCEPCDKEAVRVVKLMEKWKPGMIRGKKVRVGYTLPITYNIE